MTYDTTLHDTLDQRAAHDNLPACLRRDNLSPEWFPASTRAQLALVITLCLVFVWTSFNRLNHTDLWGHLDYGRWMVEHRALPAMDPFAAQPSPQAFVPSAWLAQVIGYETMQKLGLEGLVLGHALLATIAVGVLIAAIRLRGAPLSWAIAGGMAYYLLSLPIVGTIRPQLFGMVGLPLVLLACASLPTQRRSLLWLPIVFALWANLHGSFVMGLLVLGLCSVGGTISIIGERGSLKLAATDRRTVRWWTALLVSIMAASINPQGLSAFFQVLTFGKHTALADISEWRALSFISLSGVLFYSSLIALVATFKLTPRRWEASDLLLAAAFALLTLSAMRMLAWWSAVWPFVVMPYAVALWRARFGASAPAAPAAPMRTLHALGVIFVALLISPPTNNFILGRERGVGNATDRDTPIYVADEIERRNLQGAYYAPMDWADYLIWKHPHGFRPLVYSHVHMLSPETWNDSRQLAAGSPQWLALADKHGLQYLVISRQRNPHLAAAAVAYSRQAKTRATVLYQDRQSVLVELRPGA